MKTLKIDFTIKSNSDYPILLTILIDQITRYSGKPSTKSQTIVLEYDDCKIDKHWFELHITGKEEAIAKHSATNILLNIEKLKFNDIDVLPLVELSGKYHHNQNGFGSPTVQDFCHDLGYDGQICFDFTTPIATWMISEYPF